MRKRQPTLLIGGGIAVAVLLGILVASRGFAPAVSTRGFVELAALPEIERAVGTYRKLKGNYPSTAEGLPAVAAYLKEREMLSFEILDRPVDPWGSAYQYRFPSETAGRLYDLWSLGPDRVSSRDDIWSNAYEEGNRTEQSRRP